MYRIYILIVIFILTCRLNLTAQILHSDLTLIKKKSAHDNENQITKTSPWNQNKRSVFIKYNPISLFFIGSMFFYQKVVSPQLSRQCLYYTSCSSFSKKSINRFGFIKGVFLSADRLMRCNPLVIGEISGEATDAEGIFIDEPDKYCGDE